MILLRRRHSKNNSNLYSDILKELIEDNKDIRQDTILKLDKRHVTHGRQTADASRNSFYYDINKEMLQATLVAYKEDWDNPNCRLTILKFRYETKELDNYLPVLNKMPIFEESIRYNNEGHIMEKISYKHGHRFNDIY